MIAPSPAKPSFKAKAVLPCQGPANEWSDLEKSFFRYLAAAPREEMLIELMAQNLILFHPGKDRQELVIFIEYDADHGEDIRQLFWQTVAKQKSHEKLTYVLFGGDAEATEILQCPPMPSRWAKDNIIHVNDQHQAKLVNGKQDGDLWPIINSVDSELAPTLAEIDDYKAKSVECLKRWAVIQLQLHDLRHRLQRETPLVTYALMAILIVYAIATNLLGGFNDTPTLVRLGALVPQAVKEGEWWRLITTGFLHGGSWHLLFNGYALYLLGGQLERLLGSWRFLLLYLVSLLGGAVAATWLGGANISVGASGAIWGLMCAEAVLLFFPRGLVPDFMAASSKRGVVSCLFLNLAISFLPGIDIFSHVGGGLAGALLFGSGLLNIGLPKVGEKSSPDKGVNLGFTAIGGLGVAIMAVAVAMSMQIERPWELQKTPPLVKTVALGHEMQLPKYSAEPYKVEGNTVIGGNLLRDSSTFELMSKDLGAAIPEEEINQLLVGVQSQAQPPAVGMKAPNYEIFQVGTNSVLYLAYRSEAITIRRYFWVKGQNLWRLDFIIRNNYLRNYAGLAERIVKSVE